MNKMNRYLFLMMFLLISFIKSNAANFEGSYELKDKNAGNANIYLEHPAKGQNPQVNGTLRRLTVLWVDILNFDEVIDIYTSSYQGTTDIEIFGANDTTVSVFTYNVTLNGDGYVGSFADIQNVQNISTRPRPPATFTPAQGLGKYKIILYGRTSGNDDQGIPFFDIMVRNTKGTVTQIDDILRRGRLWTKHLALSGLNFNARYYAKLYMIDGEDFNTYYEGYIWKGDMNGIAPYGFHMFTNRVGASNLPNQSVAGGGIMTPKYQMYFNYPEKPVVAPILPTVSDLVFRNNCALPGTGGTFEFTTNGNWTFEIVLDENNDGIYNRGTERTITGPAVTGFNSIAWDGKRKNGTNLPNGTTITISLRTKSSEIHFPFYDVENQPGASGPIFNLLPADNETSQRYYWNDLPVGGADNSGLGSLTPHTWTNAIGNVNLVDTWKVAFQDIATYVLRYNCTDANLSVRAEVDVPRPTELQQIHYKFLVQNTGPATGTNIGITIPLPSGLTYNSATTSRGTYNNGTKIWSIPFQNVGDTDTIYVTATVKAGTNGTTQNYTASVTAIDQPDVDPSNNSATATIIVGRFQISGKIFEDKNYGGGAGRNELASGVEFLNGVTVELYDNTSKAILGTMVTDAFGKYTFSDRPAGNYAVRVVNSTVKSKRLGGETPGSIAVQTYRTDASSGTAVAVTNKVGGETPAKIDAASNSGAQLLTALTNVNQTPQSLSLVTVSTGDINNVNFGFNFSTIVNTKNTGQGSLRQFVINSNLLANSGLSQAGLSNIYEYSIFAIPTNDTGFNGSFFTITLTSALPDIVDSFTRFDGFTQTAFTGNTHIASASLTTGPEVIIDGTGAPVFKALASYMYVTGLGIEGVSGVGVNGSGLLFSGSGSTGAVVSDVTIKDNAGSGIYFENSANSIIIENSIIRSNGVTQNDASGITVTNSTNSIIRNNTIRLNAGDGIALFANTSTFQIENNVIESNGTLSAIYQSGIGIRNGSNNLITGNTIRLNKGDGVTVETGNGNQITQNSFYSNTGLGIDLIGSNGVNFNDNGDGDTGGNTLLNFPVIEEARIDGSNLVISGFLRPGNKLELYLADDDPTGFGEGKTYLVSATEGSGADLDAGTGSYSGVINGYNQGSDNTNRFSFEFPIPAGVGVGKKLTSIAIDGSNNTSEFSSLIEVIRNSIKGFVYLDQNHNGGKDIGESVTGLTHFVKLLSGTTVVQVAPVNALTGNYAITSVNAGTYSIILDDNNSTGDNVATIPATYIGTEAPTLKIGPIVVGTYDNVQMNFGLFRGSKIVARVLNDNGISGAAAHNGVKDGAEAYLSDVQVQLTDAIGATIIQQAITDASGMVTLWADHSWNAKTLKVTSSLTGGFISVSGNVGTTSGTFDRTARTITYTNNSGISYINLLFGLAQSNRFEANMIRESLPGTSVIIPHVFTANTRVKVTFTPTLTPSPVVTGWSVLLFKDDNANGVLDVGENQIVGAQILQANEQIHIIAKVNVSNIAPIGGSAALIIDASTEFQFTAPLITQVYQVNDLIRVNEVSFAGLELVKTVNKATALPGELLTYTITYKNVSSQALNTIVINDATPPYTVFSSATFGALPTGISNCVISGPAVGAVGPISWTFVGTLASGAQGVITYVVEIDE